MRYDAQVRRLGMGIVRMAGDDCAGWTFDMVDMEMISREELLTKLQLCVDDPMWPDHVEMPKQLIRIVIEQLTRHAQCALTWRCFHCGDVFTDAESAKEHFGPDTEWQAGCIDPLTKDESERRHDQVQMYEELDREREENSRLTNRDYVLWYFERDLAKLFNGAKSVTQAYLVLDAMEGRALAAEEKLSAVTSTHGQPIEKTKVGASVYCAHCDHEHPLHEDARGFHHVIKGERVPCYSVDGGGK